ncbi:MAG TPA: hypothetical protein ENJ95_13595 [Bacteroidetes bacterium]|nr:hypothetical protein [Bacteroidota bacterium]
MNREFLINAVFLVLVNLLIKPFYVFGIERTIQDQVGAETYGLYATLFSFAFLFFMVNDFGIHYFNNRTIAQHPQLAGKYFPNIIVLKGLLSALFLVVVFVAAFFRGFEFGIFHLLFFIALNHVFISLVAYLRSNISGLGMYRVDSIVSTLDKVFLILFCSVLLWANPFSEGKDFQIEWFVYSQNVAWLLTASIAFFIVFKKIKPRFRLRIDWPFLVVILKKSFPFALAVFLMTAYTRFDIVILEWMLPDGRYHAGVYAASYRLLDAFNMIGYLFAGLLLPMFSKLLRAESSTKISNQKNGPSPPLEGGEATRKSPVTAHSEIPALLRFSLQLIWAGTVTLAVSCFFFQNELMAWLYPKSVDAANVAYYGGVMGYLILTLVPFSGVFIYSTLLTANNSLRKMNKLFLAGIAVNVGLNLLLIPALKAEGAALAALSTQTVILLGMMWLAKLELKLPFEIKEMWRIAAFIILTTLAAYLLSHFTKTNWPLKFGGSVASGLVLAFLFRLIRMNLLFEMAKK